MQWAKLSVSVLSAHQVCPISTFAPSQSRAPLPQPVSVVPSGHNNRLHHSRLHHSNSHRRSLSPCPSLSRSHSRSLLLNLPRQRPFAAPLLRGWTTLPYSSRCCYPIPMSFHSWRSETHLSLRPFSAETWVNKTKTAITCHDSFTVNKIWVDHVSIIVCLSL